MASGRRNTFAMERTSQWVSSHDIPTDVVIEVGDAKFPLHKFMLVPKSGLIRRKVADATASDLGRIALPDIPGGAEAFEKAAKFCYGVNFEITIHNVASLRCAAQYLEMTADSDGEANLGGRVDEFLSKAALSSLPAAVVVLRSCEGLLPWAEDIGIVKRCVDAVALKACNESSFPTRSPPEWWAFELAPLGPTSLQKTLAAMRSRGADPRALAIAVTAYAQKSIPELLLTGAFPPDSPDPRAKSARTRQRSLVESITSILPADAPFPVGFLCCLLRAAIFLEASPVQRKELEKRISDVLDQASVGDLLTISLNYSGDRVADVDSLRRIVAGFVEKEGRVVGGTLYGVTPEKAGASAAMQKVAKTVDAYVGEIATDEQLSVSKFAGIAAVLPKSARRFDDDLYRAVDIYLKAHSELDEIEREKACSVMDPLKLSYEARLHASQNKRLPLQIVLQSLYYDQLSVRSGGMNPSLADDVASIRGSGRVGGKPDKSLREENEALRAELMKMKMYMSEVQKGGGQGSSNKAPKKPTFLASVSKTLGKLNPFKQGSKDTSNIDEAVPVAKPRRRRFSIS